MRIVDKSRNTISDYTEDMGYLIPVTVIKEDAVPIDKVDKFVWDDDDYEEAMMCIPYETEVFEPTPQDDTDAMVVDHEYRLTLLELGITESEA